MATGPRRGPSGPVGRADREPPAPDVVEVDAAVLAPSVEASARRVRGDEDVAARISILDLDLGGADPTVGRLVAAYRRWLGIT